MQPGSYSGRGYWGLLHGLGGTAAQFCVLHCRDTLTTVFRSFLTMARLSLATSRLRNPLHWRTRRWCPQAGDCCGNAVPHACIPGTVPYGRLMQSRSSE